MKTHDTDAVPAAQEHHLQRNLRNRHLQLIAIGGAIGTGLFMGSGKTISLAGPSVIFAYAIIGSVLFFMMRAMGELLLSNLHYKSFVDFNYDLLGPCAGFFTGWTYWFCWVVTGIADIAAITGYIQFWAPGVPLWLPGMVCILLLLGLNLLTVKLFGELEFWFALVKIVAIVSLIAIGIVLIATGFTSPSGAKAAISNLWTNGGWFPHGGVGFLAAFQIAVFAFVGIELVGTASAEARDPEKTLPKAINSIPIRVIVFYVLALLVIMTVTPWNQVAPDRSPFVNLFMLIGIPIAASLINFVVLTSATSSANSGIYSTGRMLYGLSAGKLGPKPFARLSRNNVPANGLAYSCLLLFIGVFLLYQEGDVMKVFTIVTTISSICFIFVWSLIMIAYMRYRKMHPERHATSIFKMPGGVAMCWLVLAFFAFVLWVFAQKEDTLQGLIYTPLWFVALAICYPFYRRQAIEHRKLTH
ncbi:D-serine/D-alanine/glycine transporter [Dyella amyloliquefaciens]|uniref:D-serine/D-alanine/glycine transporter n=1 Tax=Dyella amyloliquefaciens TaxID=1770545 RepID=UPI00102E9205|nr:D-serine/D-alanine/glycine transporter [Dyella amyloliquefaciens]